MNKAPWFLFFIALCVSAWSSSPVHAGKRNQQRQVVTDSEKTAPANPKKGSYHALVIGIQNYQHLRKLNTPVNDAKALAAILRDQYRMEPTLLLDATRRIEIGSSADRKGLEPSPWPLRTMAQAA